MFVGTKHEADEVHCTLGEGGFSCSILHSGVENDERDRTMEAFRKQETNVLITTNVLARGVDVKNVCLVINYDVPMDREGKPDFETYLHRIGHMGRFVHKGTAISLISDQKSLEVLASIKAHINFNRLIVVHFIHPAFLTVTAGKEMIEMASPDPEALAELIEV